jgi:hypothetical protein
VMCSVRASSRDASSFMIYFRNKNGQSIWPMLDFRCRLFFASCSPMCSGKWHPARKPYHAVLVAGIYLTFECWGCNGSILEVSYNIFIMPLLRYLSSTCITNKCSMV